MNIYPAKQQKQLDNKAIELGIPGMLLMEHAALALLSHIESLQTDGKIVIICGSGNNGGDGFALARLLVQKEYDVQLLCRIALMDMSEDEKAYARIAQALSIPLYTGVDLSKVATYIKHADIIVDALYGSGLSRDVIGYDADLIALINECSMYTIGVDIPSGLYADTGCIGGCAVKCDTTISFGYGKLGLYINEGLQFAGKVEVVDIGLPKQLEKTMIDKITVLDKAFFKTHLPKRTRNSHKGSYGKLLFIGGSSSMSGALSMAIQAALRCGVGTLTCAAPRSVAHLLAEKIDECMYLPLPETNGELAQEAHIELLDAYDVIAIGNGLGRGLGALRMVKEVLACKTPCILDGDALYLAGKHNLLEKRKFPTILTPHPREFNYLTGIEVGETVKNPVIALKTWIESNPHTYLALKNTTTLLCACEEMYLNINGNNGLSTGGSGDVLCGIIAALLAQKASCMDALSCGVYLHAYCADLLLEQGLSTYSILPRDLLAILPEALSSLIKQ